MNFRERAEGTAKAVLGIVEVEASTEQKKLVAATIEKALINAVLEGADEDAKVAMKCCSADRDLAHKIADEIERKKAALIANLSSMR
ncbi:MAG: hypothetical protein R3268_06870 [Acidiferrobacterales bacterium]|nr:hypothetical protein [Acidiferrobacterales bacterium]